MNCLIRVHPICNNIGSIGVHFGIELAFYIIRYLACLNVLVKCYQTPAQRMRALTNSVIDTVMHYHIYHYNRPSAIGHQPSAIGNHRWYLAKKAVPIYIYTYIYNVRHMWYIYIMIEPYITLAFMSTHMSGAGVTHTVYVGPEVQSGSLMVITFTKNIQNNGKRAVMQ